jgi:hypothetical protein
VYWQEWLEFKEDVSKGKIKLSLAVAKTVPTPTVGNFDLGRSALSRFGLDTYSEHGFPFINGDE